MKQEVIFTLQIDCSDQKGLIYLITSILFKYECNIIRNDEYVSPEDQHFFMRSEFSCSIHPDILIQELKSLLPHNAHIRISTPARKRIVVLVTKEHHCLSELLTRVHFNELKAEIVAVISNYENLQDLTEKYGIPYHYIPHTDLTRESHEEQIAGLIENCQPDYVILAKYMRILSPAFVDRFHNRIINIHHSFLPAFIGANPYWQAFERGVKIIGATAHYVNNNLDEGPIIAQSVIPVDHKQDASSMSHAGKDIEKMVLSNAIRIILEDKVFVWGNKTVVFE